MAIPSVSRSSQGTQPCELRIGGRSRIASRFGVAASPPVVDATLLADDSRPSSWSDSDATLFASASSTPPKMSMQLTVANFMTARFAIAGATDLASCASKIATATCVLVEAVDDYNNPDEEEACVRNVALKLTLAVSANPIQVPSRIVKKFHPGDRSLTWAWAEVIGIVTNNVGGAGLRSLKGVPPRVEFDQCGAIAAEWYLSVLDKFDNSGGNSVRSATAVQILTGNY